MEKSLKFRTMENKQLSATELAGLKAYVFALYYGQKVMKWYIPQPPEATEFTEIVSGSMLEAYAHECYLQLRPLSSITDDEAIEVAKIKNGIFGFERAADRLIIGNKFSEITIKFDGSIYQASCEHVISVYQYLQQYGFALPVYYKGVYYSVERLVAENIIVLIK